MSSISVSRGSNNGGKTRASKHVSDRSTPQLSCESCQERKVKCDKLNPCTNCRKISVKCIPVHRKRLPRGRHVQKDNDMRDRIRRLEALVSTLDSKSVPSSLSSTQSPQYSDPLPTTERAAYSGEGAFSKNSKSPQNPMQTTVRVKEESMEPCLPDKVVGNKYLIGKHFWEELVQEVSDLRGILEHESGDDDDADSCPYEEEDSSKSRQDSAPAHHEICSSSILGTSFMYAAANRSFTSGALSLRPTPKVYKELCRIYVQHFDPLVKVLHRPSLERFMLDNQPYLHYEEGHTAVEALSAAVCYAAVASMTSQQCMKMFGSNRRSVAAEYRMACEAALERAGLVVTNDITVVQAFCIYLIATRAVESSRAVWVLMPVLVRLARAIALDKDSGHWRPNSFFNHQMRRRLWYIISWLDLHTSFARGSEPLISPHEELPPLPKNLNDTDFGPDSDDNIPEVDGFSDMTFSIMVYNAQRVGKILNFSPTNEMKANSSESKFNWDAREKWVDHIEREIYRVARNVDPNSSSYAWFCRIGSRTFASAMKLSVLRPMHRSVLGGPPRLQGATQVLQLAAVVLESSYLTLNDPRGECYRWYVMVQWHALAIAIAESYECKDTGLLKRVWPLIEAMFEHHKASLTPNNDDKLWKPMEKMMKQVRVKIRDIFPEDQQMFLIPLEKGVSSQANVQGYEYLPVTGAYMDFSLPKSETNSYSNVETASEYMSNGRSLSRGLFSMPIDYRMDGIDAPNPSPLTSNNNTTPQTQAWYPVSGPTVAGQDQMNQMLQAQQASNNQLPQQILDPAWCTWESFVNGLAMDPMGGVNFSPSNLENTF